MSEGQGVAHGMHRMAWRSHDLSLGDHRTFQWTCLMAYLLYLPSATDTLYQCSLHWVWWVSPFPHGGLAKHCCQGDLPMWVFLPSSCPKLSLSLIIGSFQTAAGVKSWLLWSRLQLAIVKDPRSFLMHFFGLSKKVSHSLLCPRNHV